MMRPSRSIAVIAAAAALAAACTSDGTDDGLGVPGLEVATTAAPVAAPTTTPPTLPPTTTPPPSTTPPTTIAPTTTVPPPTTTPPSTTPPTAPPGPFYRAGDEGPEIAILQLKLQTVGFLDPGYTEGVFDGATNRAVLDFQGQYGLIVDGIVGPETEAALTAAALSVDPEPG